MTKPLIGLDLDDVLMDFNTGLCAFHNARYGTLLTREHIVSYFLEEIWGCSREEAVLRVADFYLSLEHEKTLPIVGAQEAIRELSEKNDFVIVTSRPERVASQTRAWLKKHFPLLVEKTHFASHFFHTETTTTKGEVCRLLGADVFIDDAPFHVEDVAGTVRQALLFDAPWNRSYTELPTNVRRVYSWNEILAIFAAGR